MFIVRNNFVDPRTVLKKAALAVAFLSLAFASPAGTPPGISPIADSGVYPNGTSRPIAITIDDLETAAPQLILAGYSSDTNLIPNSGLAFGGSGSNRTVRITPAPGQTGTATITLTVADTDGDAATNFFVMDVNYFTPIASGLPVMQQGKAAWGDYDNDGYPDLAFTGYAGFDMPVARIYHNNHDGTFTDINAGLVSAIAGEAAWADIDRGQA